MVVVDWAKSQAVDVPAGSRGLQSPDGSRILTGVGVVTTGGELVGSVQTRKGMSWRWADDSRHLCAVYLDGTTPPDNSVRTPTKLYETLPGSNPAAVAEVGYLVGQAGPSVLACGFGHGTATVGETCVISLCETWTVDLLSGRIVSHLTGLVSSDGKSALEGQASPDGTLLALSDSSAASSTIYRTADGTRLATLPGSRAIAFTADDKAVLVTHTAGPAQLLDLQGGVVATLSGRQVQATLAEPGGSRIAVALGDPGATANGFPGPADLVLVGSSGKVVALAQGVLPQF